MGTLTETKNLSRYIFVIATEHFKWKKLPHIISKTTLLFGPSNSFGSIGGARKGLGGWFRFP